jgi:hypothetical protein
MSQSELENRVAILVALYQDLHPDETVPVGQLRDLAGDWSAAAGANDHDRATNLISSLRGASATTTTTRTRQQDLSDSTSLDDESEDDATAEDYDFGSEEQDEDEDRFQERVEIWKGLAVPALLSASQLQSDGEIKRRSVIASDDDSDRGSDQTFAEADKVTLTPHIIENYTPPRTPPASRGLSALGEPGITQDEESEENEIELGSTEPTTKEQRSGRAPSKRRTNTRDPEADNEAAIRGLNPDGLISWVEELRAAASAVAVADAGIFPGRDGVIRMLDKAALAAARVAKMLGIAIIHADLAAHAVEKEETETERNITDQANKLDQELRALENHLRRYRLNVQNGTDRIDGKRLIEWAARINDLHDRVARLVSSAPSAGTRKQGAKHMDRIERQ